MPNGVITLWHCKIRVVCLFLFVEYQLYFVRVCVIFANESYYCLACFLIQNHVICNKIILLFLTIVTCGVVLTEEDLQRLTEHDLLNNKVITGTCSILHTI